MLLDEIKIIFQDIDGCLNPSDGEGFGVSADWQPSASQVEMLYAIDAALEASSVAHFVINTGRPWPLVRHLAKHLHSPKARYFLLEHACVLYDREMDVYVDCAQLAEHCGLGGLAGRYQNLEIIEMLFNWYRTSGQPQLEAHYKVDLTPLEKLGNLSFVIPEGVDGAEILQRVESLARAELHAREINKLDFLRSDSYVDILPGIHKLDGIHLMAAHLDIDLKHALAVGDYLNDLSVFESFIRVLCPANAHPQIKALAQSKGASGQVSALFYGAALIDLLESLR